MVMKRSKPLARSWIRRRREGPTAPLEPKPWAPSTVKPVSRATYVGGLSGERIENTEPYRDRTLLDMAEGRPCLLLVPACCNHRLNTTVACHSNMGRHGKAGARKADDHFSAWGCSACHEWLDRSGAPIDIKNTVFLGAHIRQVFAWQQVAADPSEPARFRRAARRALDRLNATQGATA